MYQGKEEVSGTPSLHAVILNHNVIQQIMAIPPLPFALPPIWSLPHPTPSFSGYTGQ